MSGVGVVVVEVEVKGAGGGGAGQQTGASARSHISQNASREMLLLGMCVRACVVK